MEFFNYATGLTMTNDRFDALFGGAPRKPDSPITQREMDLAASAQSIAQEAMPPLARAHSARDRSSAIDAARRCNPR